MAPQTTSSTPTLLGHYEVGARIGGGGMATVYLGRRVERNGEEKLVALKVIRDELAHDDAFARMFIDEAKILARLSHPNIIRTLEYGASDTHRFIAMELLSGRTYADVWNVLAAAGEGMPVRLGAFLCARVAEALHCAHELEDEDGRPLAVVHRDVNPGNIFLTLSGEVKLIDFGLAKANSRISDSIQGIVKGKIPYLAPEQVAGSSIDRRVDVYALGATLWETATMKRLFKRDTDVATLKATIAAHVPDVREMVDGFPDELWAIIARSLARNPDERYATAKELAAALDAFVGDSSDLPAELSLLLERLFPDDEANYEDWLTEAQSVRVPSHPMVAPPTLVPFASSTLLKAAAPAEPSPSPSSPPEARRKAKPGRRARARARARAQAQPAARTSTASTPPQAKKARGEALASRIREGKARPRRWAPPRRVWLAVAFAAALLVVVMLAVAR